MYPVYKSLGVKEECKDEARHGKAFLGLLERHFGKQA